MGGRRKLASEVLVEGISFSEACRRPGITRRTGRKWVRRSQLDGLDGLLELSRAPLHVIRRTDGLREVALLELKEKYPQRGDRTLVLLLERDLGIRLATRTVEHILRRHGLTAAQPALREPLRFERESMGALLETSFKGLPESTPYALLTVLDDHGRYSFEFGPVEDRRGQSMRPLLWNLFGDHGVHDEMLMDNGDQLGLAVQCADAHGGVADEARRGPIHGRPRHPLIEVKGGLQEGLGVVRHSSMGN